jgi:hypothetical protein
MHDCSETIDMVTTNARPKQNDTTSHAPLATCTQSGSFAGAVAIGAVAAGAGAGVAGAAGTTEEGRAEAGCVPADDGPTLGCNEGTDPASSRRATSIRTASCGKGSTA